MQRGDGSPVSFITYVSETEEPSPCFPNVEEGGVIRKLSSYLMLIAVFIIAIVGNWIVLNYSSLSFYPRNAYILLGIGLTIYLAAFVLNHFSSYKVDENLNRKDNRELINKLWDERMRIGYRLALIGIVVFIIVAIYDFSILDILFPLCYFVGVAVVGFFYVIQEDGIDEPDDTTYKPKTKKFLHLIDYRRHPFNISLIIFLLIISSFILSKEFGIVLSVEVGGNSRYVTSLPVSTFAMSGLMLVSTYTYIINNSDIFGIRKYEQDEIKVLLIHIMEIISCGSTFMIWLVTVVEAILSYF